LQIEPLNFNEEKEDTEEIDDQYDDKETSFKKIFNNFTFTLNGVIS
jgi:hypothetical protein